MTVKLLVDWKDPSTGRQYRIGNLLDTDDYTEAGLIASKQAQADLTGGTAQTDPVVNHGDGQVVRANPAGTALVVGGAFIGMRGAAGVVPDGIALDDATTNNSAVCSVSSDSANFVPADIGKICALHSRLSTAQLQNARYGTITAITDSTHCTATLNAAPGVLTDAHFVYGTDNTAAMQAAIDSAAASDDRNLILPPGIICVNASLNVPGGMNMYGSGRTYTEKNWYEVEYTGTTISMCGYENAPVILLGDDTFGPVLAHLNVDANGLVSPVVGMQGRCGYLSEVTLMKALGGYDTNYALNMGPGSMVKNSTLIGGNNCHVCNLSGDAQLQGSNLYGAGTGYAVLRISGVNDVIVSGNHIWTDSQFSAKSVKISAWQTWNAMNSILISGNQFDTAKNSPHIHISIDAGCSLRGVNISNNNSFNNDSVTTPYPWIDLDIAATGKLRGLMVEGNSVLGSWYTPTAGVQSALIDGAGISGSCLGSIVTGNYLDRPSTGAYVSFTPTVSDNNVKVSADGTETVF